MTIMRRSSALKTTGIFVILLHSEFLLKRLYTNEVSNNHFLKSVCQFEKAAVRRCIAGLCTFISDQSHYVKSVQIRSYFWSVFSCIRTEYKKIRTRNNSVFGHFSRSEYQLSHAKFDQINHHQHDILTQAGNKNTKFMFSKRFLSVISEVIIRKNSKLRHPNCKLKN